MPSRSLDSGMAGRLRRFVKWWFAVGLLLAGCLGGQTGQPGDEAPAPCDHVPPDQRVNGQSPAELARRFEGSHSSRLRWVTTKPRDAGARVADDEITIVVSYGGEDGTTCNGLSVPVNVVVTTKNTGVNETGTGYLNASSPGSAILTLSDAHVVVSATLRLVNGVVAMSGRLSPQNGGLPGEYGEFPPAPDGGAP